MHTDDYDGQELSGIPRDIQPVGDERWQTDKSDVVLAGAFIVVLAVIYVRDVIRTSQEPAQVLVLATLAVVSLGSLSLIFRRKVRAYRDEHRK